MTNSGGGGPISMWLGVELDEIPNDEGRSGAASAAALPAAGAGGPELPRLVGQADPGPQLRNADGTVRAGALLGMLDVAAGFASGLAALPRWAVTTNLSQRVAVLPRDGVLTIEARPLRVGRNAGVTSVAMTDQTGRVVVSGILTAGILTKSDGLPFHGRPLRVRVDPASVPTFPALLGAHPIDDHVVALEVFDALRNPWGTLHGGVIGLLADVAAVHAAEAGGPRDTPDGARVSTDMLVHFLSPGRVGPIHADARVLGARPDGMLVRVEVRDVGAEDRVIAFAVVVVARVDSAALL